MHNIALYYQTTVSCRLQTLSLREFQLAYSYTVLYVLPIYLHEENRMMTSGAVRKNLHCNFRKYCRGYLYTTLGSWTETHHFLLLSEHNYCRAGRIKKLYSHTFSEFHICKTAVYCLLLYEHKTTSS
jgi:hypothetical protein